jgi:hypothetical protein
MCSTRTHLIIQTKVKLKKQTDGSFQNTSLVWFWVCWHLRTEMWGAAPLTPSLQQLSKYSNEVTLKPAACTRRHHDFQREVALAPLAIARKEEIIELQPHRKPWILPARWDAWRNKTRVQSQKLILAVLCPFDKMGKNVYSVVEKCRWPGNVLWTMKGFNSFQRKLCPTTCCFSFHCLLPFFPSLALETQSCFPPGRPARLPWALSVFKVKQMKTAAVLWKDGAEMGGKCFCRAKQRLRSLLVSSHG